jgi:hypothetical protein
MNMIEVPMVRIRATPSAMYDAYTLAEQAWCGEVPLPDEPGARVGKTINGFRLCAMRLRCGGIEVYQRNWRGE